MANGGYRHHGRGPAQAKGPGPTPLFDSAKDTTELVDELAERQAEMLGELKSSQLRRFFGEAKDLFRRLDVGTSLDEQKLEQRYQREIAPQFKMLRSKASYAWRNGQRQSKIPRGFHDFIENGVKKVRNAKDFDKFIRHFEAVVGFAYGKGLVSND